MTILRDELECCKSGISERLLLLTLNPPEVGQVVNLDGERWRVLRVLRFTGTVAKLELELLPSDPNEQGESS